MNGFTGPARPPGGSRAPRRAAVLAGAALLAAACGGSRPAGPGAGSPPNLAQAMASYVRCMHQHGEPGVHVTHASGPPTGPGTWLNFHGYAVQVASPGSPRFGAAQQACGNLLPHRTPPSAAEQHRLFMQSLKTARCMRAHGYPDWPDPQVISGAAANGVPAGIDTSSPHYQSVARKCGAPTPAGS